MHKVINFFLEPFGKEWAFFIALWLLASSADVYFWSIHGNPAFGIYMGIHGFIQVYAIVLLLGLFRNRFRTILQWILLALGVLNLCADTCVHRIMHFGFTGDMVAIILGSNFSEASEFLPMYVTPQAILFIVSVIALAFLVLYFRKTISAWMKPWLQWGLAFVLLSFILLVSVRHSRNWEGVFLNKIGLFLSYDAPVDLTGYRTEPEIEVTGEQPETVVMIIGESLSKRHCSLYGYPRQTTPFWDAMAADSSLIVYNNVSSAYTNTVGAFQRLLTTYDNHAPEDTVWYKYTFLEDVMSMAGYRTTWISNQSSSGIYDNIVAKFAALSDTVEWVGPKGLGIGKTNKDEDVFPFIQTLVASTTLDKNFVIIHLMGFRPLLPDSQKKTIRTNRKDSDRHWPNTTIPSSTATTSYRPSCICSMKKRRWSSFSRTTRWTFTTAIPPMQATHGPETKSRCAPVKIFHSSCTRLPDTRKHFPTKWRG